MKTMNLMKRALVLGIMTSAMFSITAFADITKSVTISFTEGKEDPGTIHSAEPKVSGNAEIVNWEASLPYEEWKAGKKVTFTIDLDGRKGYTLSRTKTDVRVSGKNAELASKSVDSGDMTLRVNYWPSMQLAAPTNIYFEDEFKAVWDKVEGAKKYEVKVYADGKTKKTVSVTKNEIDLSEFATDGSEITFDVRAVPKDDKESKYLKASDWTDADDSTTASSDNSSYGKFSGSGQNMTFRDDNNNTVAGWQVINGNWYFFNPNNNNKAIADAWAQIDNQWYYFNEYGILQSGWLLNGGQWYFLNPAHDGTFGRMMTGWIQVGPGSPRYLLNAGENPNLPYGAMYSNTTTPDGHTVDASGACYDQF